MVTPEHSRAVLEAVPMFCKAVAIYGQIFCFLFFLWPLRALLFFDVVSIRASFSTKKGMHLRLWF